MTWICAALSDADRAAARQAGGTRGPGRRAGPDARHRARGLRPRVQQRGQLDPVVPAPPAVRHAEPAAVRPRVPADWACLPGLQRGVRRRAGRRGAAGPVPHPGPGPGLPPQPGPAAAARPARRGRARHRHRALLAHPVGAARLLPAAARPGRPGAARRHSRRGPRRLSRPALGRRVPGLLRGDPRRGGGPDGRRQRRGRAGPLPGARDRGGRAPARRGRARAARPGARAGRTGSRRRARPGRRRTGS